MYLSQILKCICLQLQNVFVSSLASHQGWPLSSAKLVGIKYPMKPISQFSHLLMIVKHDKNTDTSNGTLDNVIIAALHFGEFISKLGNQRQQTIFNKAFLLIWQHIPKLLLLLYLNMRSECCQCDFISLMAGNLRSHMKAVHYLSNTKVSAPALRPTGS